MYNVKIINRLSVLQCTAAMLMLLITQTSNELRRACRYRPNSRRVEAYVSALLRIQILRLPGSVAALVFGNVSKERNAFVFKG